MADLGRGGVGIKEGRIAGHGKDEAEENPAFGMSFSGRKPEARGLAAPGKPHGPQALVLPLILYLAGCMFSE